MGPYPLRPEAPPPPAQAAPAKRAGVELIVIGILVGVANLAFLALSMTGDLEDLLWEAGYTIENQGLLTTSFAVGAVLGIMAVVAGFEIRGLHSTWRVVGIAVAGALGVGQLLNLAAGMGNLLSFVMIALYVQIIVSLVRSRELFT